MRKKEEEENEKENIIRADEQPCAFLYRCTIYFLAPFGPFGALNLGQMKNVHGKVDLIGAHVTAHVALPRIRIGMHSSVYGKERILIEYYVTEFTLVRTVAVAAIIVGRRRSGDCGRRLLVGCSRSSRGSRQIDKQMSSRSIVIVSFTGIVITITLFTPLGVVLGLGLDRGRVLLTTLAHFSTANAIGCALVVTTVVRRKI
jgi:hypothetical protein